MDEKERIKALTPNQSFIVEAPAGSGKTELLTLRYLTLLNYVHKDPEEVVAVTFTRKAASEMKHRVIQALKQASSCDFSNLSEYSEKDKTRIEIAKRVLVKDQENSWYLLENPSRLRILTIDALCTMLAYRTPILSHFGGKPEIHDSPEVLYKKAIESFIRETTRESEWYPGFEKLLLYFDNMNRVCDWFIQLLANRDQWLPYLFAQSQQQDLLSYFKKGINTIKQHVIEKIATDIMPYEQALVETLNYLHSQYVENGETHVFCEYSDLTYLPTEIESTDLWLALCDLLLVKDGGWRKVVNKNQGFYSASSAKSKQDKEIRKAKKSEFEALLKIMSENMMLNQSLNEFLTLPDSNVPKEELDILIALQQVLPVLVGFLRISFKETGKVDFVEMSLGALHALRDETGPTEVAQALDYTISHILVDEFQDTSALQFQLLEQLICEWTPTDSIPKVDECSVRRQESEAPGVHALCMTGVSERSQQHRAFIYEGYKTVFLVGDPQQSIYRFRGAEVGVFLHAQQYGIANIILESISLKRNFRSQPMLVDWVSDKLKDIFPKEDNLATGAVTHKKAYSAISSDEQASISVKCFSKLRDESLYIVEQIKILQKQQPQNSLAVLVRAKKHLVSIIALLKANNIPFYAKEISQLIVRPHVIDLISLAKGLFNWNDRIAWLSVLRAPWLGLQLIDIYKIIQESDTHSLWEIIKSIESVRAKEIGLSTDTIERLQPFVTIIDYWLHHKQRRGIAAWLKGLWNALGCATCYPNDVSQDIDQVFILLEKFVEQEYEVDFNAFEEKLTSVYADQSHTLTEGASIQEQNTQIQLMTIHQAKGLEFDTVILPGLQMLTNKADSTLLQWHEGWYGQNKVFLMGAKTLNKTEQQKSIFYYLSKVVGQKNRYELIRLLYVALTRAKSKLFLCFSLEKNEANDYIEPKAGSFLELLWDYINISDDTENKIHEDCKISNVNTPVPFVYRAKQPIDLHRIPMLSYNEDELDLNRPEREYHHQRIAGIIFHRIIAYYCQNQQFLSAEEALPMLIRSVPFLLRPYGLAAEIFENARHAIHHALKNIFSDEKGLWIIDKNHQNRLAEKAFSSVVSLKKEKNIAHIIVDCAFIDENNQAWVVDFKLTHSQEMQQFDITTEAEKYKQQLLSYKKVLEHYWKQPVRVGLYFPALPFWYEYSLHT
ncbi:UvrD-helicase domain-containing protein [Candidatus Berkiella cookevillensis]|uniref:DNA 3'-5' helicase n=1 Tax=Candidatus Berkiella cookevillensis TaxID=437022 RepID=A0A0Q9YU48_9GAMM|nr:UvrD-helicase domain-containing protein [Candidatus Berkiella cookevillensis]MCS5708240.1 UvrD-helicase domain-containing protein [Candidatus Berkiella cookevillensis]